MATHREDLEALEKLAQVTVSDGDVLLLYWTLEAARRARRLAKGNGFAGYHADVAYFLKERASAF